MTASTLRIVHISTSDNLGGASRSAFRLHNGLVQAGHDSRMLVGFKSVESPRIHGLITEARPARRLVHALLFRLADRLSLQYLIPWPPAALNHPFVKSADVVNLHNTHGSYFSHTLIPALSRSHAVVWTLHDMWALTGHCPYCYDCDRWLAGCGRCPRLSDYPALPMDTTALHWRVKEMLYSRSRIVVVAPSRWLANLAQRSPLLGRFPVHHIPYGLDLTIFRPLGKDIARELLGLPQGRQLVLFAANDLRESRKGTGLFLEALQHLDEDDLPGVGVVTLGGGATGLQLPTKLPWWHLGTITDDRLLRAAYSATDVFVCASPVDNLPNTVLESFACGTPVVGFNIGGIPDMISHMETGYLARETDPKDLARGIQTLLKDPKLRHDLGLAARKKAEKEYGMELQASRYENLYKMALATNGKV